MNAKTVRCLIILAVLLSCAYSCAREPRPEVSPDKVLLELYAFAETYHKPVSRTGTADETSITTPPWVFVFEGSDDNAVLSEIRQSFPLGGKTYIALAKKDSPCRLLILANPPAIARNSAGNQFPFDQTNLENQFLGRTIAYVVDNLITSPLLVTPQPTVPYTPGLPLPMSALLQVNAINENTIINDTGTSGGNPLPVNRIVAKVIVDATAVGSNFTLLGATVIGAPRSGALAQLNGAIKSNSDNLTDYISPSGDNVAGISAAVGNTTAANPIYMYESAEVSTSVIIKGIYNGVESYYRILFQVEGQRIDVRRNHSYTFVINDITRAGYPTLADASANPPSSITTTLLVTDLSSFDLTDNGLYYLGLTNSEFVVYEDALNMSNVLAVTALTNAPTTVITRNIEVEGAGLSLSDPGQQITVTGAVATTDININMSSDFTQGIITVNVGDLSKKILVRRVARLSFEPTPVLFPTDYVAGQVTSGSWLGFSLTPDPAAAAAVVRNDYSAGDIYMIPTFNSSSLPRSATAYLSRSGSHGRVKVYAVQGDAGTATSAKKSTSQLR